MPKATRLADTGESDRLACHLVHRTSVVFPDGLLQTTAAHHFHALCGCCRADLDPFVSAITVSIHRPRCAAVVA